MNNPRALIIGTPIRYELDGVRDDLLTAGLGPEGLRGPVPEFADPVRPTPLELRRRAIYMNYRGLVDVTAGGGFGTLFGPSGSTLIAGVEYLFAMRTPDGAALTSALLQIPKKFDRQNPCLVAVASSGSRGIYGALPTAGEWGLRHGCAVVHSDKGTGTGIFDADRGQGIRIDGTVGYADDPLITFSPVRGPTDRLKRVRPHSILFKHANCGVNVEAHWGDYLLQAIDGAFQLLNREYPCLPRALAADNTLIIASGISNGGGAALRALERDHAGWIDGAVVSEPNAAVTGLTQGFIVESGGQRHGSFGASLYDYTTEHLLLQPSALLAEAELSDAIRQDISPMRRNLEQWSRDLGELGILPRSDLRTQSREARRSLLASGVLQDALQIGHFNVAASVWLGIAAAYASSYACLAPDELPCGLSFAATNQHGAPRAITSEELARMFSDSHGVAPTAGISVVMSDADGQPRATNPWNARLAACLRALHTGECAGLQVLGAGSDIDGFAAMARRVAAGEREVAMTARTSGRPVIILHGRADALIPVNHSSRAYFAVSQSQSEQRPVIRYYEIEHGQHFDALLALPDFARRYVPLQAYLVQAMDLMAAHLRTGTPLPPSQVLRSRPRRSANGMTEALAPENLGALLTRPDTDSIVFTGHTLHIP